MAGEANSKFAEDKLGKPAKQDSTTNRNSNLGHRMSLLPGQEKLDVGGLNAAISDESFSSSVEMTETIEKDTLDIEE
jgi:hypothetical protein